MAIDVTRAGGKGRRPSNRNSFYGRVSMGQEIIQSWPKKRGKKLHPKTLVQMEIFRQAQWAFKFSSSDVQRSFSESVARTPLMPRDLFLMAVSGRMHRVIDDQGRSWWSVAAKKNISDSLDVIAQLPGQMLFRGLEIWRPILQGVPGYVLTYVSDIDPPVWAPGGGSSGIAWGDITGALADQLDLVNAISARALLTGDNDFVGDQVITGDVDIEGTLTVNGSPIEATASWGSITGTLSDQVDLQAELDQRLSVSYITADAGDPRYMAARGHAFGVRDSGGNGESYLMMGAAGHGRVGAINDSGSVTWDIGEFEIDSLIHVQSSHSLTFDVPPLDDGQAIFSERNLSFGTGLNYDPLTGILSYTGGGGGGGATTTVAEPGGLLSTPQTPAVNFYIMRRVVAGESKNISKLAFKCSTASPTTVFQPFVYQCNAAGVGTALLGSGPQHTGTIAGYNEVNLTAPVALVKGEFYLLGVSVITAPIQNMFYMNAESGLFAANGSSSVPAPVCPALTSSGPANGIWGVV